MEQHLQQGASHWCCALWVLSEVSGSMWGVRLNSGFKYFKYSLETLKIDSESEVQLLLQTLFEFCSSLCLKKTLFS